MDSPLTIHWTYLFLGVAMLWFPRQWLRLGRVFRRRRRQREQLEKFAQQGRNNPDDRSVQLGRELGKLRNYLDFFRALAGGFAVWQVAFDPVSSDQHDWALGLAAGITVVAVAVQGLRYEKRRVSFFAPVFFMAGLGLTMDSPVVGGFAFLLVCAINPMLSTPRMFLTLYAILLVPFGYLFGDRFLTVLVMAVINLLLPIASLMAGRPVVIFTRKPGES